MDVEVIPNVGLDSKRFSAVVTNVGRDMDALMQVTDIVGFVGARTVTTWDWFVLREGLQCEGMK